MASTTELIKDYYNVGNQNLNTHRNYTEIKSILDDYDKKQSAVGWLMTASWNGGQKAADEAAREWGFGNLDDYLNWYRNSTDIVSKQLEPYSVNLDEAQKIVDTGTKAIEEREKESAAAKKQIQGIQTAQKEQAKKQAEAQEQGIVERVNAAQNAAAQGRVQGLGRGLAASIGNNILNQNQDSNYLQNYGNLASLGQSTQNDYLQKMGYADSLNKQADNIEKGRSLQIGNSIFQGAGAGASFGATVGSAIR